MNTAEARAAFAKQQSKFRQLAEKGGSVGFTEPVEMGGDGAVVDLGEVVGREALSLIAGIPVELRGQARVVQAADGTIKIIAGGEGEELSLYDAQQVLPGEAYQKALNALRRDRDHRKKRIASR